MALDKNKSGIIAAISAAAEGQAPIYDRAHRTLPKGTVGSVRAGLGGIQEIETKLIQGWGPKDRLELTAVNSDQQTGEAHDLVESIRVNGQQVPVLLRPAADRDGHFDVIYGRRRIMACEQLGIPVKALIRTMDDKEALMAKGLENASRMELSFYERARFAQAILEQGHSREEAMQALSISKNVLSQLERVVRLIPDAVGDAIGAAPGAGRPKWMSLASIFEKDPKAKDAALKAIEGLPSDASSDARLQAVLDLVVKRGPNKDRKTERQAGPGITVKSTQSTVTLILDRAGDNKEFVAWFERHTERLMRSFREAYRLREIPDDEDEEV